MPRRIGAFARVGVLVAACAAVQPVRAEGPRATAMDSGGVALAKEMADESVTRRLAMVESQLESRGIRDTMVLAAMGRVPRHEFVPEALRDEAYQDRPLPIGLGQTISQPYIVAVMTELARIQPGSRVLEVGTGSGYGAAVVHEVAGAVHTIEIVEPLAKAAAETLARLGYAGAQVRHGDGYRGWPEAAPFDAILVTAAPERVPQPLLDQLRVGGRLVIPVGDVVQHLEVHTRTRQGFDVERVLAVRFVPMTGEVREPPSGK